MSFYPEAMHTDELGEREFKCPNCECTFKFYSVPDES